MQCRIVVAGVGISTTGSTSFVAPLFRWYRWVWDDPVECDPPGSGPHQVRTRRHRRRTSPSGTRSVGPGCGPVATHEMAGLGTVRASSQAMASGGHDADIGRLLVHKEVLVYWLCALLERDGPETRAGARRALAGLGYDQARIISMLNLGEPGRPR